MALRAAALLTAGVSVLAVLAAPASAADAANAPMRAYPSAVPTWATPRNLAANQAPANDPSFEGEVEIYLPLRDPAGAVADAVAVSTPGNPRYRHYLTPQAWIAKHSPTKADYDDLVRYLKSQGAEITAEPADREFVVMRQNFYFDDNVLHAAMRAYDVDGTRRYAPSRAPELPSSIADKVAGIVLDGSVRTQPGSPPTNPNPVQNRSDLNCSPFYGFTTAPVPKAYGRTSFPTDLCGYWADQLRDAVGVGQVAATGLDGAGQTIAVVGTYDFPTIRNDVNELSVYENGVLAPMLASQYTNVRTGVESDQDLCGRDGWQGEDSMDVEAVHAVAPAAHVDYVAAFNCGGGEDAALATVLDRHLASIVTTSATYSTEEVGSAILNGQRNLQLQAAAEGIGLYYPSGDNGDNSRYLQPGETLTADWPATSPWVTAVGGTNSAVSSSGATLFESGWEMGFARYTGAAGHLEYQKPPPGSFGGGSGGGRSIYFTQPAYQRGLVGADLARGANGRAMRALPDVATDASTMTPMLVGYTPTSTGRFQLEPGAGTSLATPLMAAKMALAQQQTHTDIGFANPVLYARATASPTTFGDIVPITDNRYRAFQATANEAGQPRYLVSLDAASSLRTGAGYDLVTGLGDPGMAALFAAARVGTAAGS